MSLIFTRWEWDGGQVGFNKAQLAVVTKNKYGQTELHKLCIYIYIYIYIHTHTYIYIYNMLHKEYIFFLRFFPIIGYYKILNTVPCGIQ